MKLTGKCKIEFDKWLKTIYGKPFTTLSGIETDTILMPFQLNKLPDSMQYGVLVDFFDSLDVFIYDLCYETQEGNYLFQYEIIGFWGNISVFHNYDTRHEARTEAILKANEIFNQ